MDNRNKIIFNLTAKGLSLQEIAENIGCSKQLITTLKSRSAYAHYAKQRENEQKSAKKLNLNQRIARLISIVVDALEDEITLAEDNNHIIAYSDKLAQLTQVVGKPKETGGLGVLEVPTLLTKEVFNDTEQKRSEPIVVQEFAIASQGEEDTAPGAPDPRGSLKTPRGHKPSPLDKPTPPQRTLTPSDNSSKDSASSDNFASSDNSSNNFESDFASDNFESDFASLPSSNNFESPDNFETEASSLEASSLSNPFDEIEIKF